MRENIPGNARKDSIPLIFRIHRHIVSLFSASLCIAVASASAATIEVSTSQDLIDASRGKGRFAACAPGTTFLIKNGTYRTPAKIQTLMCVKKGGEPDNPRIFRGESRAGVIIYGRATITADHVNLENMTFDLRGFTPEKDHSFSTISMVSASDLHISHITCTGDGTKGRRGGHIEIRASDPQRVPEKIEIDNCLVEGFGERGDAEDKLAHGIYLGEGRKVTIKQCVARNNTGRGIQLFSHFPDAGMIEQVLIEGNRIHHNGRQPYTDGLVISAVASGNPDVLSGIIVRHNIIFRNTFSGIRIKTQAIKNLRIENNTFYQNATGFPAGGELFFDTGADQVAMTVQRNIFVSPRPAVQSWRRLDDLTARDNLVEGMPGRLKKTVSLKNILTDPEKEDFSVAMDQYQGYGAQQSAEKH